MDILKCAKNLGMQNNVSFRVYNRFTGELISEHVGHNAATNSLLTGIAHYLKGDGVLNQGYHMLSSYVPRYISLGTMGLLNQDSDDSGLPSGIGVVSYRDDEGNLKTYQSLSIADLSSIKIEYKEGKYTRNGVEIDPSSQITEDDEEALRFADYINQAPGFGADGYDPNTNNNRTVFGLGPQWDEKQGNKNCELVSTSFPRVKITYRDVVPETEAELPGTIDVVFSAFISTGALAKFRGNNDHIYITEAGLWSRPDWVDGGDNGLLAGYRIAPPSTEDWDMAVKENRDLLKRQIIRVGINQVVQVVWKIQIGGIEQLTGIRDMYPDDYGTLWWVDYAEE